MEWILFAIGRERSAKLKSSHYLPHKQSQKWHQLLPMKGLNLKSFSTYLKDLVAIRQLKEISSMPTTKVRFYTGLPSIEELMKTSEHVAPSVNRKILTLDKFQDYNCSDEAKALWHVMAHFKLNVFISVLCIFILYVLVQRKYSHASAIHMCSRQCYIFNIY